jgi:multidrug efflux pump subunit AcrB
VISPEPIPDGFFGALVRRPVALLVIFTALCVVGVIAYVRIPLQMMPDGFVDAQLQIWASNPGASAAENETKVARVIEEQLRTLTGIESIESGSSDDSVWVEVTFDVGQDMDIARAEVRDRIERARPLLPASVTEVGLWSFSQSALPVMFFALLHPGDNRETDFLVDNVIKRRLEAVDGVGRVEIWGVLDDSMRILLDEERVRAANLDLGALIERLSQDNFAEPLGEITDGGRRVLLRSDMRFGSPEEIAEYPIGAGLRIKDVGRVLEVKSVRNRLFKIDNRYAFYGEIQKDSQANVVATCKRVQAAFEELAVDPRLRGEFRFLPLFNQGNFIESSLSQLQSTAVWGGGLALAVLLMFLRRIRLTLAVALSIPVSVLLAIAWSYFTGGSFNILTMTGITLAMGMLVDNSVVVIENISRLRAEGAKGLHAAAAGTHEVALAVTLATLTTVVVFLPMIFMGEDPQMRLIFGELGLPLCLSLLFSLFGALVFLPVVAARLTGPRPALAERAARALAPVARIPLHLAAWTVGLLRLLGRWILLAALRVERALLALLCALRWPLAATVLGATVWAAREDLPAFALARRAARLAPGPERPQALQAVLTTYGVPALICVALLLFAVPRLARRERDLPPRPARLVPQGDSTLDLVIGMVSAVTRWTLAHRIAAAGVGLAALLSVAVPMGDMSVASFGEDENTGRLDFHVRLDDDFTLWEAEEQMQPYEEFLEARRERYGFANLANRFDETGGRFSLYWDVGLPKQEHEALQRDLRDGLPKLAGHTLILGDENVNARNRNVVAFRLTGPDSERLEAYGRQAIALLRNVPGLNSVTSGVDNAPRQVNVQLDSDLAQGFGISAESALNNIAWALRGWQLPQFQEPGREIPLLIEYDDDSDAGLSTLRDLEVFAGEAAVPLSSFAELEFGEGSRTIRRRDGQTSFHITARVDDPLRQKELSDVGYAVLRGMDLPRGYGIGEDELVSTRQEEELAVLRSAMWLSLVLVFLLMGILFESLLLPFSVLFTIPFAIVGSLWTLYLTGTTMDSVGWIGIIILIGVVVNNGIVLIDRIHGLRGQGVERSEAVLTGTAQRVRPVLMTALTTVIGLVPMTIAEPPSDGIDYRALATCVAGGLTVSTFFTLWIVPLAYTLIDDFGRAANEQVRWALRLPRRRDAARAGTA